MSEQRFAPDEVEHIIRQAMKLESDSSISRDDLIAAAMEVGIPRQAIEHAIDTEEAVIRAKRHQSERHQRTLRRFQRQASGMGIIVLLLFLIDAMTYGGWWFQWPLLGIGVALAFRARNLYFPR